MIKQITVSVGRTVNLGNFESLRIEGSATVEIEPGQALEDAEREALDEARKLLVAAYNQNRPKRGTST